MPLVTGKNRHITFDEDEEFEDVPALEPLSKDSDGEAEEEEESAEDTDSDGAPEEATLTAGKEEAQKKKESAKNEMDKLKQQIKEKRKQQHKKNILQQEEKRQRLEERRLPQSLLDAVATEQKIKPPKRRHNLPVKKKRKIKHSDDADKEGGGSGKNVDDEGLVTIDTGVRVGTLNEEAKKYSDISKRAADFRMNALYGGNIRRMSSAQLQEMKVKRRMSGKAVFATLKT